jgi:NAD(P)-dependent dehydrogenase (short-subunit alcohol dehydrogenase family)
MSQPSLDHFSSLSLSGRVAMVVGCSSGIGQAIAVKLEQRGAIVALVSRSSSKDKLETIIQGFAQPDKHSVHVLDLDQSMKQVSEAVQSVVDEIVSKHGRLDIAVNNSGIYEGGRTIDDEDLSRFDRVLSVNTKAVLALMGQQVKAMKVNPAIQESGDDHPVPDNVRKGNDPSFRPRESCSIVNIASVDGLTPTSESALYNASKAAVVSLTQTAALEYANQRIRVNVVCPGWIYTAMTADTSEDTMVSQTPMHRVGRPQEIGEAVAWLASDSASFVTGVALPVDGGYMIR